jgi:hypothetical protein
MYHPVFLLQTHTFAADQDLKDLSREYMGTSLIINCHFIGLYSCHLIGLFIMLRLLWRS